MSENPESGDKSSSKKGTLITAISGIALIAASAAQISGNLKPVWEFLGVSESAEPTDAVAADDDASAQEAAAAEEAAAEEIRAAEAEAERILTERQPDYAPVDAVARKIAVNNSCNRAMQVKLIYQMPDTRFHIPTNPADFQEFAAGDKNFYYGLDDLKAKTKRGFVLVRSTTKDGTAYMDGDYPFTMGGQTESYTHAKLEVDDYDDYYIDLTCPT